MDRRVLIIATTPSMIGQFNMSNIRLLQKDNYQVEVACDFNDTTIWTAEQNHDFRNALKHKSIKHWQIDFSRSIKNVKAHIKSYHQLFQVIKNNNYCFVHCHTPIASAITRIVCHKLKIPVIYTAHGFHFYKGAPAINWILFYPVETLLSHYTSILITINQEDFERAKNHMHAKKVELIPSVGLDTSYCNNHTTDIALKRNELRIPETAIILLSVGELSSRKNHKIVIEALSKIKNESIYYLIAGLGSLKNEYETLIKSYGLQEQVLLLGFRTDILDLCKTADIFVHPSLREGLGMAPLEAMASGLPLIASNINGMKDYVENGKTGYCVNPKSVKDMVTAIQKMCSNESFRVTCGDYNKKIADRYDIKNVEKIMKRIYSSIHIL